MALAGARRAGRTGVETGAKVYACVCWVSANLNQGHVVAVVRCRGLAMAVHGVRGGGAPALDVPASGLGYGLPN